MKLTVIHTKSGINKEQHEMYNKFFKLLQKEFPLKDDLKIEFLGVRKGGMTTGSRLPNYIKVLCQNRMTRDIFRTIAHEWVHEHQHSIEKRKIGPDIGGRNEDEANAYAGQLIKIFEKKYPEYVENMYE
jgi:hypothetical protein